mmetsp:Transcript_13844/g.36775  ORF Transcript_13844/g.36775 Transcript_13844/m.36775 type:complete len:239 (-) Transcript_13844:773-1489(-)
MLPVGSMLPPRLQGQADPEEVLPVRREAVLRAAGPYLKDRSSSHTGGRHPLAAKLHGRFQQDRRRRRRDRVGHGRPRGLSWYIAEYPGDYGHERDGHDGWCERHRLRRQRDAPREQGGSNSGNCRRPHEDEHDDRQDEGGDPRHEKKRGRLEGGCRGPPGETSHQFPDHGSGLLTVHHLHPAHVPGRGVHGLPVRHARGQGQEDEQELRLVPPEHGRVLGRRARVDPGAGHLSVPLQF